jgi:hypothetical protein
MRHIGPFALGQHRDVHPGANAVDSKPCAAARRMRLRSSQGQWSAPNPAPEEDGCHCRPARRMGILHDALAPIPVPASHGRSLLIVEGATCSCPSSPWTTTAPSLEGRPGLSVGRHCCRRGLLAAGQCWSMRTPTGFPPARGHSVELPLVLIFNRGRVMTAPQA